MKDGVMNNADAFCTVFVPSDRNMTIFKQKYPEMYNSLKTGSTQFLQLVMESHVIYGKVYHSNLLEALTSTGNTIQAMQGKVRAYWFNNEFYVSNDCVSARILTANKTVSNGVVYIVDNLLGFIFNDLITEMQRNGDMSDFNGVVRSASSAFQDLLTVLPGVTVVPDSKKFTVFAPATVAFASGEIDFSQDPNITIQQLGMHMLQGVTELLQIVNGSQKESMRPGYFIKFYQISSVRYVEVDYVRARILAGNICTKNGVIHLVDKILGVPARTVYNEVQKNPNLLSLREIVRNTGVQQTLDDMTREVTLFAPVEDAFTLMRATARGNDLLNRQNLSKLKNVMLRMMVRGSIFLDTIPLNGRQNYNTYFDTITVSNENGEFYVLLGQVKIHVIQANMRMKNGMGHVVARVLYEPDNPVASEWTVSMSATVLASLWLPLSNLLLISSAVKLTCRL